MLQGKWLLKHRFVHETEKKKLENTPQNRAKTKVATPGMEFVQL